MNREVHVRFWESAGLRCPAPLNFIKAYASVAEARQGIGGWLSFYNEERLHQALGYRTPCAVFDGEAHEPVDNTSALKGCGVAHRLADTELKRELIHVE
jgi:hypothetical protein